MTQEQYATAQRIESQEKWTKQWKRFLTEGVISLSENNIYGHAVENFIKELEYLETKELGRLEKQFENL